MRLEGITPTDDIGWLCNNYFSSVDELKETGYGGELRIDFNRPAYRTSGISILAFNLEKQECDLMDSFSTLISVKSSGDQICALGSSRIFISDNITFKKVESKLFSGLGMEPVEDGSIHTLEMFLEKTIQDYGSSFGDWLIELLLRNLWNSSLKAGLLRLLSRLKPFTEEWRLKAVELGLSSPDVELRDAAVQAAENWEDVESVQALCVQAIREDCPWLKNYISCVIRDLSR